MTIPVDWTVNEDGRSNSSDEYLALCEAVAALIRGGCGSILDPLWVNKTAGLIVAQLAHRHNVGPLDAPGALAWVKETMTLDAIDAAVRAIDDNPGWRLIAVGTGSGGQTTLTYGWGWPP